MKPDPVTFGGEFRNPELEAHYRLDCFSAYLRDVRWLFWAAFGLNVLFYLNDARFLGHPHFPAAMGARTVIVLASLAGALWTPRCASPAGLERLCLFWAAPVYAAGAILVDPHTDVALIITFVLPMIFYLTMPLRFRWTLGAGLAGSALLMAGYLSSAARTPTTYGLLLAQATSNGILLLMRAGANRLHRLEWSATRAERSARRELAEHRAVLQSLLKAVPTPMLILTRDEHRLIGSNDAAQRYFGIEALEAPRIAIEDYLEPGDLTQLRKRLERTGHCLGMEARLRFPDGRRRDVLLAASLAPAGDTTYLLTAITDITERKEMEARLEHLAATDPLTGLANRNRFFATGIAETRRARRYRRPLAVLMVDIDLFKHINDTYGHDAGDQALRAFADLCRATVRAQDLVARLGGEEFGILLPETHWNDAYTLAERLRAGTEALDLGRAAVRLTVSIGLAQVMPTEETVDAALSRADRALYAAKRAGRNRVVRFDPSLVQKA